MEDVIRQYLTTVRPMHLEFVEPSKRWADVILPEGGHNRIGVEMILARVELELSRRRRVGQDAGRKTQDAG
jgi:uridine kinase